MPTRVRSWIAGLTLAFVVTVAWSPAIALAQAHPHPSTSTSASAAQPPGPPPVAPDSPRASIARFEDLCRAGEFAEAAAYLDVPENEKARAPELARRLQAVLDREIRLHLDKVSADSAGRRDDKLPPDVEEIAVVTGRNGPEQVRVVRRMTSDGARWVFSRRTVEHVDAWFDRLGGRWLENALPAPFLRTGPEDLLVWQWIALPLLFAGAWILGRILAFATGRVITGILARDESWRPHLRGRLIAPLSFAWALAALHFTFPYLTLGTAALAFLTRLLIAGALFAFFWLVVRLVDVGSARLLEQAVSRNNPSARSLVPLGTKVLKIVVFAIGITAALAELGFSVTSLVAGLGIGGVALALAAQKTVENLFGSLSISLDRPFRVGDIITVDTVTGTVESIGLRSTRLRTDNRTRVTIPNGKLADMRIECVSDRDRIRFTCTLPIDHGTSAEVLKKIIDETTACLRADGKVFQADVQVALTKVSPISIDVDVVASFATTSFDEFLRLRQAKLLEILGIVADCGAKLVRVPTWPTPS